MTELQVLQDISAVLEDIEVIASLILALMIFKLVIGR